MRDSHLLSDGVKGIGLHPDPAVRLTNSCRRPRLRPMSAQGRPALMGPPRIEASPIIQEEVR